MRVSAAYGREESCKERAPTAADSEKPHYKFNECSRESADIGDVHPFTDCLVRIQGLVEFLREKLLLGGIIEAPDLDRVEPEFSLPTRTVRVAVVVACKLRIAFAIVLKVDRVVILSF